MVTPSEWSVVLPSGQDKPFLGSRHGDEHRFDWFCLIIVYISDKQAIINTDAVIHFDKQLYLSDIQY